MWFSFFLAIGAGLLFVFVPGYLLLRAFGFARVSSFACAPCIAIGVYSILCIAYDKFDIHSSWMVLFVPLVVVCVILFLASRVVPRVAIRRSREEETCVVFGGSLDKYEILCFALIIGFSFIAVGTIFVLNLDGAASFVQEYDNVYHLAAIRSCIESGNWSSLTASLYLDTGGQSINPLMGSSFYPFGYHTIAAMIVGLLGVPVPLAVNAVNTLFVAVVYPCGMFLLLRLLFQNKKELLLYGAFCVFAFSAFPWKMLYWGPIFPNLASLCLLPAVVCCFMAVFEGKSAIRVRVSWGLLFFVGIIALAFLQPNSVFTAIVFLFPYCVNQIVDFIISREGPSKQSRKKAFVAAACFSVAVGIGWLVLYKVPFLQNVVTFSWPAYVDKAQALVNVLLLSFRETPAQILLGALVVVGVLYALKRREYRWLVVSYGIACIMYIFCAATDGTIKQVLTGFWYADPVRLAANAALFAIPLATIGLFHFCKVVGCAINRFFFKDTRRTTWQASLCAAFVALLFVAVNFYPSYSIPGRFSVETAFGATRNKMELAYSTSAPNVYDSSEREFVQEVKELVSPDDVIVNEPNDGSAFAYGVDGLNVYYRTTAGYGGPNETEDSKAIRENLVGIDQDVRVKKAVDDLGAAYVLHLDHNDKKRESRYLFSYYEEQWIGIDDIEDTTPGFELVLSSGDMRLYKIGE